MGKKHPNPRLTKINRNYTVEGIATLYGIHKNTVRGWIKRGGLQLIDNQRPMVIHGSDLREFLEKKRKKNKCPCKPGEIYCVRCRAAKSPDGNMADYEPSTKTMGSLIGICPDCETIIYRRISLAKIELICGQLNITLP